MSLPVLNSTTSAFALWFLKLKFAGHNNVVCPDSMSFVTDVSTTISERKDWLELVKAEKVGFSMWCFPSFIVTGLLNNK